MRSAAWLSSLLFVSLAAASTSAQKAPVKTPLVPAAERIAAAITAMGGEARLMNIKSLRLESIGHGYALEQSERPEGPWLTTYSESTEVRDFEHQRRRYDTRRRNWSFPSWSPVVSAVIDGGVAAHANGQNWAPGVPAEIAAVDAIYALSPEKLLLTARSAADLHSLPNELQQKVKQHVVAFTWNGQKVRLFLNAWTDLPTMLEIVRNETRFGNWGDVTERRWYTFWSLEKGGLMYPRQTTTEWNGFPYSDETVQVLKVDEPVDEAALTIPEATRTAFAANANRALPSPTVFDGSKGIDVTDWLVEVPSGYNVSIAKQPDGLVIIEATTGNDHADAVMAFAKKRFPGLPIKAVVTTSDAWPHISGIREYVAAGIPIYALDLNVSILTRFVKAPHTLSPDRLQQSPRAPVFRPVTSKTVIGTGETRIELVPVRGEIGERMMLAWIPGAKVLYSSDMIQRANPSRGVPFFMPLMLMEVERAAAREKITGIERVFGMHLAPTPWSDVLAAIAAAKAQ
jgi:glyoxylase-like metal-dependent hydrolase (beta-lactamase superfamily II)